MFSFGFALGFVVWQLSALGFVVWQLSAFLLTKQHQLARSCTLCSKDSDILKSLREVLGCPYNKSVTLPWNLGFDLFRVRRFDRVRVRVGVGLGSG